MSLVAAGRFTENLSAGRGYLALAAVILGRWHPLGAAAAVLLFGAGEALQISLQGHTVVGAQLPGELLSALPYLLGLLALAGALGKVGAGRDGAAGLTDGKFLTRMDTDRTD